MQKSLFSKLILAAFTCFQLLPPSARAQSIVWQKALGGTGDESCSSIVPAHDSGYIMCGMTSSTNGNVTTGHGGGDFWAVRLSNTGNIMWQKTYGGSGHDYGSRITPTADGGYIMVGGTRSVDGDITSTHGNMECWVVKMDNIGNLVWQKTYGGSGNDFGNAIQQTLDGGYIIAGYTASPNDGDVTGFHGGALDCWVVKINDTGAITWARTYGGTGEDGAIVIRQLQDSSYIFGGYTMSWNGDVTNYHGGTSDGGDAWVVKIGKTGVMKWQKAYGGSFEEQVFDMTLASNNNYIIAAATRSYNGDIANPIGQVDGWVFRLDDTGKILWQKSYGTPTGSEHLTGIYRTPDNGFAFTGWAEDLWIGKTDSMGTLQWQKYFGGSGWDAGWAICLGNGSGYVMAGNTYSTDRDVTGFHGGPNDIWVLKVSEPSGISVLSNTTALKVYPNPVYHSFNIEGIETTTGATLFNMTGQTVKSWILKPGNTQLSIADLPPGMYQLQLINGDGGQQYEKIIKLN